MPTARATLSAAVAAPVFCVIPLAAVPAHAVPAATQPFIVLPSAVSYNAKNCKALNKKYAHEVGRSNTKDKISGKKARASSTARVACLSPGHQLECSGRPSL
jgi:hypothetical protein